MHGSYLEVLDKNPGGGEFGVRRLDFKVTVPLRKLYHGAS